MCIPPASEVIKPLNRAQQECKQTKQKDEAWGRLGSRTGKVEEEGGQRDKAVSSSAPNYFSLLLFIKCLPILSEMWVKVHAISSVA